MSTIFLWGRGNRAMASGTAPVARAAVLGSVFAGLFSFVTHFSVAESAALHHVVRPGENLSRIAAAYDTTVEALVQLNQLRNPDRIRVGQRLVVREESLGADFWVHVVGRGETLSEIAARYQVKTADLAAWNGIGNPNRIVPGQELIILAQPIQHRVARGENITTIARKYGVTPASIAVFNGLENPNIIRVGQLLTIPPTGGAVSEVLARAHALEHRRVLDLWPVQGPVSSRFGPRDGRMHEGIDIAVPHGTPVKAVAAGRVTYADWAGSYGILVTIDHGGGIETRYAHNSRVLVKPGDYVQAGQVVARSGSTGRSTGPHVHFELRVDGQAVDPWPWLP